MKVPYPLTAATKVPTRHAQMAVAIARGFPRLGQTPIDDARSMSVACYGPSLAETWRALTRPILSMSGATRFLADRGVVPDFHLDMDPRAHKIKHLVPPVPGVHYLMASVCPPETWDVLAGERVTLWHTYSGKDDDGSTTYDWVARHDPGELVIHGGSTIGLTALHVGGVLGYRHFEVHGMDGSFGAEGRHAGPHYGTKQLDGTTWAAGGVTYRTSKIMANAVAETINTLRNFPVFCVFHGEGLTQALVREAALDTACRADDDPARVARVRRSRVVVVDAPVARSLGTGSPWDAFLGDPDPAWVGELLAAFRANEARRRLARYDTGAIGVETALLLRALVAHYRPRVAVEVGTFIGNSAAALAAAGHLYTCDRDNDCLPSTPTRTCYPYRTSTEMLADLVARGIVADLVFLDGRLSAADVPLLLRAMHARTAVAFDDFDYRHGKGMANVALLRQFLPRHALLEPYKAFAGRTTLAALLPPAEAR